MASNKYIDDTESDARYLAQLPAGEPLLPPGTVLEPSEEPQDLREALIKASLGDALRSLREANGLTGPQLAQRLGINKQRVSVLEHLITDQVEVATLNNVAQALGCELEITFRPQDGESVTVVFPKRSEPS